MVRTYSVISTLCVRLAVNGHGLCDIDRVK